MVRGGRRCFVCFSGLGFLIAALLTLALTSCFAPFFFGLAAVLGATRFRRPCSAKTCPLSSCRSCECGWKSKPESHYRINSRIFQGV